MTTVYTILYSSGSRPSVSCDEFGGGRANIKAHYVLKALSNFPYGHHPPMPQENRSGRPASPVKAGKSQSTSLTFKLKRKMEKDIEKIPTYALPYLVNGDASNLTEDEIKQIDEICREQGIELVVPIGDSVEGGTEPYFSSTPLFGKPTEVEDCIIIHREKD